MTTLIDIDTRLRRMETKMMRGFEEMGIDTEVDPNWITVDPASCTIYVSTLGRSLQVVQKEAMKRGAAIGKRYELVHRGEVVAALYL